MGRKKVVQRTAEFLERTNSTDESPVIESIISMQTGSGEARLAGSIISGEARLGESTISGEVHQARGIKTTEAMTKITSLNLVVLAKTEENLQIPGEHQIIRIV